MGRHHHLARWGFTAATVVVTESPASLSRVCSVPTTKKEGIEMDPEYLDPREERDAAEDRAAYQHAWAHRQRAASRGAQIVGWDDGIIYCETCCEYMLADPICSDYDYDEPLSCSKCHEVLQTCLTPKGEQVVREECCEWIDGDMQRLPGVPPPYWLASWAFQWPYVPGTAEVRAGWNRFQSQAGGVPWR